MDGRWYVVVFRVAGVITAVGVYGEPHPTTCLSILTEPVLCNVARDIAYKTAKAIADYEVCDCNV